MDEQTEKGVHIYLKSEQDHEKVLKEATPHERYIILTNETLQAENRELQSEKQTLETRVEELEEECGRNEKGQAGTKSFLHNLVLMQRLTDERSELYSQIEQGTVATVKSFNYRAMRHFRFLQIGLVAVLGMLWELHFYSTEQFAVMCVFFAVYSAFHESTLRALKLPDVKKQEGRLKEIEKELKKLHESNDFLNELIDLL